MEVFEIIAFTTDLINEIGNQVESDRKKLNKTNIYGGTGDIDIVISYSIFEYDRELGRGKSKK